MWVGVFGATSDNSFRKNGGDDGTRTRDLCRDREVDDVSGKTAVDRQVRPNRPESQ
jgi:hypothetical protein